MDIIGLFLAVMLSCVFGAPADILWNKEENRHTGMVENLLNTPGDLESPDNSISYRVDEDSELNDKHPNDFDLNFMDSRSRRYDPSAFTAFRGKRMYNEDFMDNIDTDVHRLQRRRYFPGGFVAIRGKKSVPPLPITELQVLNLLQVLSNQRKGKSPMQKRQPPFGFHALRGR